MSQGFVAWGRGLLSTGTGQLVGPLAHRIRGLPIDVVAGEDAERPIRERVVEADEIAPAARPVDQHQAGDLELVDVALRVLAEDLRDEVVRTPGEAGILELGTLQASAMKIGVGETSARKIRTPKVSAVETGGLHVGVASLDVHQVGAVQLGASQVGAFEEGKTELRSDQIGAAQIGTVEVGAHQVDSLAYELLDDILERASDALVDHLAVSGCDGEKLIH